jgi:hypothetical protein
MSGGSVLSSEGITVLQDLKPGAELAGYRIESIERDDGAAAVLRAQLKGRTVALHVAAEPPGSVAGVRFLERAHRLQGVVHPHLLPVYEARAIEGRALAVAEAPPGRRLDKVLREGPLAPVRATRIASQVAAAVEALEGAGAELPPLTPERVWVNAENAYLDPLDGRSQLARADRPPSSSAAVADLLEAMLRNEPKQPAPLREIVARALDGAYFSVSQIRDALCTLEEGTADRARRRRRIALAVAVLATLVLAAIIAIDRL